MRHFWKDTETNRKLYIEDTRRKLFIENEDGVFIEFEINAVRFSSFEPGYFDMDLLNRYDGLMNPTEWSLSFYGNKVAVMDPSEQTHVYTPLMVKHAAFNYLQVVSDFLGDNAWHLPTNVFKLRKALKLKASDSTERYFFMGDIMFHDTEPRFIDVSANGSVVTLNKEYKCIDKFTRNINTEVWDMYGSADDNPTLVCRFDTFNVEYEFGDMALIEISDDDIKDVISRVNAGTGIVLVMPKKKSVTVTAPCKIMPDIKANLLDFINKIKNDRT